MWYVCACVYVCVCMCLCDDRIYLNDGVEVKVWGIQCGVIYSSSPKHSVLRPDDLRWNWCNNNRNKVHNKCNVFKLSPHHSPNPSTPTLVHGKIVSHKTGPSRVPVCVGACIGFHSGETGTAGRVWEEAWEDVTNVSMFLFLIFYNTPAIL